MIKNNLEHVKAEVEHKIKNNIKTLILKIGVTVVIVSVFVNVNLISQIDMEFSDELGNDYNIEGFGDQMLVGEFDRQAKEIESEIIVEYKNVLENNVLSDKNVQELIVENELYNKNSGEDDVISLNSSTIKDILWELGMNEERNDPNYKLTIKDLEKLTRYDTGTMIDKDYSWLGYCKNLNTLEVAISNKQQLKHITSMPELNIKKYNVTMSHYSDGVVLLSEVLGNFPELETIIVDTEYIKIDKEAIDKIKNCDTLGIKFSSSSQKTDFEILKRFNTVKFYALKGSGIYDIPTFYSKEEFNAIINSNINIMFIDENGNVRDNDLIVAEMNKIYDQIDKIYSDLNINDKMSDEEKLNQIIKYTIDNLTYSENVLKIMDEKGYTADLFGRQPRELTNYMDQNVYKDGCLYGALNKNGEPVCGSYAAFMNVLMEKAGLESYFAESNYHAYNIVNVDGEYYFVDGTLLDSEYIDLDEYMSTKKHLIKPQLTIDKSYKTNNLPNGIEFSEIDPNKEAHKVLKEVKKEYKIKVAGGLLTVSLSVLISILSALGLSNKYTRLSDIEQLEYSTDWELDYLQQRLERLKNKYELLKNKYDNANKLKKAMMVLNGEKKEITELVQDISILEEESMSRK